MAKRRKNGRQKRKDRYFLLSLGCAKNTVDSESMAQLLERAGLRGLRRPSGG